MKGRALHSHHSAFSRRTRRSMANKIDMQGVQVRTDKGDVWFLDSTRMGWVPKAQILAQPTHVLEKLKNEGFNVADDCIDELIVHFQKKNRAEQDLRGGS